MTYVRPDLGTPVLRDRDGEVIPYGHRWSEGPAEWAYSVTAHPERFAPLTRVADALVDHLVATYDVARTDVDPSEVPWATGFTMLRAVRLVPSNDDGAPLTLGWSDFPGVVGVAGAALRVRQPFCGCDACDEDLEYCADELERTVLAVADGRLEERLGPDGIATRLTFEDGWSGWSAGHDVVHDDEALARLRRLPHGWQPWRRRG